MTNQEKFTFESFLVNIILKAISRGTMDAIYSLWWLCALKHEVSFFLLCPVILLLQVQSMGTLMIVDQSNMSMLISGPFDTFLNVPNEIMTMTQNLQSLLSIILCKARKIH